MKTLEMFSVWAWMSVSKYDSILACTYIYNDKRVDRRTSKEIETSLPKRLKLLSAVAASHSKRLKVFSTLAGGMSKRLKMLSAVAGGMSKRLKLLSAVVASSKKELLFITN
jgi:excinuclease UvrABC ATPase subunit